MPHFVLPVVTAVLLSILIPAVVEAAVRRGDRNRRAMARPDVDTGALFVVRNRRWQSVLLRVVGIVFLVVGALLTLVSVMESEQMDGPGPLVTGAGITVAGALFVVLATGVRRFRVDAFDDHLTVRPWFRATRVVRLTEIGSVSPSSNPYGGVDVRDVDGRMLFTATRLSIGYQDIVAHLQAHYPPRRTTGTHMPAVPAVPGDVASWQGTALRAEWSPVPRGRKGTLESGVLLTAGGLTAHMRTGELVALLDHKVGIVESTTSDPLVFLCRPDAASPTSTAWELTKDLPAESLALLAEPMDTGTAAVLTGPELAGFSAWITALPRGR